MFVLRPSCEKVPDPVCICKFTCDTTLHSGINLCGGYIEAISGVQDVYAIINLRCFYIEIKI